MWFRRAYFNLHLRVKNLSNDEGWAAGSWFVPIINLYRPFQIMKELYVETKKYIIDNDESSRIDLNTNIIVFWWTLWIINGIFGQLIFRLSNYADTIPDLIGITVLSIISGFIGIVLAIVTLKMIKDYSKAETVLRLEEV